jgi:hypothetical protein
MASDGLVLSDDMDWSLGFIDYCREGSVKLAALIAPPTMFGVALPLRREPKGRANGERLAGASRPSYVV